MTIAAFTLYLFKSTLCLLLFYVSYKVLLSRETFFRFNRFVLLTGMLVCAILPLVELKTENASMLHQPLANLETMIMNEKNEENEENKGIYRMNFIQTRFTNGNDTTSNSFSSLPSFLSFPIVVYSLGLFTTLAFFLISVIRMSQLIRKGNKFKEGNYTLVLVDTKICPFSFGKYIVLSQTDYGSNPDEILTHEKVHARKRHSIDLLFAELFIFLHWFNPAAWLLKKELQDVHEYEADLGVLQQGIDAIKYQLLLVKKAVGARSYTIANSFNQSKLKTRITMMLKRKSNSWARLRLVLMTPLAITLLQAFAHPEVSGIEESLHNSEGTTILQNDQGGTKEYFDRKVDEYLKNNGKELKPDWINYKMILGKGEKNVSYMQFNNLNGTKEVAYLTKASYSGSRVAKSLCNEVLKQVKNELKKGSLSPQFIFVQIDTDVSKASRDSLLKAFAKTNEEIKEMLKNPEKYSGTKKIAVKDMIPFEPVFVAINERAQEFPAYSKYDNIPKDKMVYKETIKYTPPVMVKDSVIKVTKKFTPSVIVKDEPATKSSQQPPKPMKEAPKFTPPVMSNDTTNSKTANKPAQVKKTVKFTPPVMPKDTVN